MYCSEPVAEPHLEGTTQQQMDRRSLTHAFSVAHEKFVKCYVKLTAQVQYVGESRVEECLELRGILNIRPVFAYGGLLKVVIEIGVEPNMVHGPNFMWS